MSAAAAMPAALKAAAFDKLAPLALDLAEAADADIFTDAPESADALRDVFETAQKVRAVLHGSPAVTVPALMAQHGLAVQHTGGGCMAYAVERGPFVLMVTDSGGCDFPEADDWLVGVKHAEADEERWLRRSSDGQQPLDVALVAGLAVLEALTAEKGLPAAGGERIMVGRVIESDDGSLHHSDIVSADAMSAEEFAERLREELDCNPFNVLSPEADRIEVFLVDLGEPVASAPRWEDEETEQ